jgi:hypothetical protein
MSDPMIVTYRDAWLQAVALAGKPFPVGWSVLGNKPVYA